ncbi:unnamed protein product [Phytophthora fragariaefolia]|uniref:Unnamed protein product n=1 Tax=Phytophthora fragariaefolia TaxID=1490495 RepID=A0A9W6X5Z0_9STRA|nr:unnamed protein product [Phytophthora fragariaefolia]
MRCSCRSSCRPEEQILYRRQQPGVVYPKEAKGVTSKLMTIENASLYTDLSADAYWVFHSRTEMSSCFTEHPVASALYTTPEATAPVSRFAYEDALKHFKECALKPFARDQRRELVFLCVIWVKLDFVPSEQNGESEGAAKPVLAAIDIATESIELNIDFDQIAVLLEELEHVLEYFKRYRTWKWRPSCIDREHHTPPRVDLVANAIFPIPPNNEEDAESTIFSVEKQRKSRQWFRAMWRYAFRCIIDQQQRSRKESSVETDCNRYIDTRCWWRYNETDDKELEETRRKRYIHLYARNLSPGAMEIALYGRGKALLGLSFQDHRGGIGKANKDRSPPPSPRRRPLPQFDPLTREELWELSDYVATMKVYEQRLCRAMAENELRIDFTSAPPSPKRKISPVMEFSISPTDLSSDLSSRYNRSVSVDALSSPPPQSTALLSEITSAAERRQFKRGLTIDPAELSVRPASRVLSRPHAASTSNLPSPTKHENALDLEPLRAWIYKQRKLGLHATSWFEKQIFPTWFLNSSRVIPLLNWQIGPVTLRLSEGYSDQAQRTKRGIGIQLGIESCTGAMLLTRMPFMRILVEVRMGLFHVTLVRNQHPHGKSCDFDVTNVISEYKWISGDYIRLPEDGFFYIGLKYSAQEVAAKLNGKVHFAGNIEEELGLKGRMCIGPIKIHCNEGAMRLAMGQAIADELRSSNMDLSTSNHFSILQDAYHSFVSLVAHLPKRKGTRKSHTKDSSPRATKRSNAANTNEEDDFSRMDQLKLEKSAKRTRMLHALLLRSSMFEVEVGTLELNLSAYTSHIEKALQNSLVPKTVERPRSSETREDVNVMLPTTTYRLQNRPSMNECVVDVAGVRVVYRSTKQGRSAVVRHLVQLFKL